MDRVACCRRAAREAIADVEPPSLHDVLVDEIDDAVMTPGVVALESAAAADADADLEAVAPRAAGVQLIYEGLRLTRALAHEEPWTAADERANARSDLEILAADILVARGFYLLARTDAADRAVRTVRAFGRDQTLREEPDADREALDAALERDVLELAVLAGAAAVGEPPTADALALADDVADRTGTGFPPAGQCLLAGESRRPDHGPSDRTATDRATSATDP